MAKNNINLNQLLDAAVLFPQWQCEDATATAMKARMRSDLAVMNKVFGDVFRIDNVKKVGYKLGFEGDMDASVLVESGDVRKEMCERIAVTNVAVEHAKEAKKALMEKLPERKLMELAISDSAQGRGNDMLTACWVKFLVNLGVDRESLSEGAVQKFVDRMIPLMNTVKVTRNNSEVSVDSRQASVNQLGLTMWTALTLYLTKGLVTDVLDSNGQFTFVVDSNGKKTRKHVTKLFGGQYEFDGVKYVRKDRKDA